MNKIVRWQMFFVALGAFVIGVVAGSVLIGRYIGNRLVKRISDESFSSLSDNLGILERLRAGETNAAIDYAELRVVGNMLSLGSLVDSVSDPKQGRAYTNMLVRAVTYRAKHGLRSDIPGVEARLDELAARFPARVAAGTNQPSGGSPPQIE